MNKTIKILVILCVLIFIVSPLRGFLYFNQTEAQGGSSQSDNLNKESDTINRFIVLGASHFLKSGSALFSLLNETEMSEAGGYDFEKAGSAVGSAAKHLSSARATYIRIVGMMKAMNVDQALLGRLREFDYAGYARLKGLHPDVMAEVASLMSRGDKVALYERALNDIEDLLNVIGPIQKTIQQGIIPKIEDIRTLYLKYSDSMLFGFYVSLVFSEIR